MQLSSLSPDQAAKIRPVWVELSTDRKNALLSRLIELGEENVEFDFSQIFLTSLEDENGMIRKKGVQGLWESEDRTVINPLIELLLNDPLGDVRVAAALSLGKFAASAQDGKLIPRDARRILDSLMETIDKEKGNVEVRRRAIEGVASFNIPRSEQIVRDAYASGDARLIQSAVYGMGQSSNSDWLPTVIGEMRNEHPGIRYEAAVASGKLGDETVVPHLIQLIQNDDIQIQTAAVSALGEIGGLTAKRALNDCLAMDDEAIVEAVQTSLETFEFDEDPLGYKSET